MPSFYRIAVEGRHGSQSIVNILYYTEGSAETAPLGEGDANAFLAALEAKLAGPYIANFPVGFTLTGLTLTRVNEMNETISDYPIERPLSLAGTAVSPTDGSFVTAIISARCSRLFTAPNIPVPKRSYVAWGPVLSMWVEDTGALAIPPTNRTSIRGALFGEIEANALVYRAARVGRGAADGGPRAGLVDSLIFRPYASIRKSRKTRPSGEGV